MDFASVLNKFRKLRGAASEVAGGLRTGMKEGFKYGVPKNPRLAKFGATFGKPFMAGREVGAAGRTVSQGFNRGMAGKTGRGLGMLGMGGYRAGQAGKLGMTGARKVGAYAQANPRKFWGGVAGGTATGALSVGAGVNRRKRKLMAPPLGLRPPGSF